MRGRSVGIIGLALLTAGIGCGPHGANPTTAPADAAQAVSAKPFVLQAGGKDVLTVTAPADTTNKPKDGLLSLKSRGSQVDIWLIPTARSLDDAIASAPTQITSEFKDFKTKTTTDLTIAGSPAKQMMGAGTEADDGDPGSADVIVFKAGDRFFVACTHGEHIPADAPVLLLSIVQSAK